MENSNHNHKDQSWHITVEHDNDETEITILDDTGDDFDINIIMSNGTVYIRQTNPDTGTTDLIAMTDNMYRQLVSSYTATEGYHNE